MTTIKYNDHVYNLDEMERGDILALKSSIDEEIAIIGLQLGRAQSAAAATGEYSDRDWYWNAVTAKKVRGRLSQKIQTYLARTKPGHGLRRPLSECFVDVARIHLSADTFEFLLQQAKDLNHNRLEID